MRVTEVIGLTIITIFFTIISIALYFDMQKNIAETKLMEVTTLQIVEQNKQLGISK